MALLRIGACILLTAGAWHGSVFASNIGAIGEVATGSAVGTSGSAGAGVRTYGGLGSNSANPTTRNMTVGGVLQGVYRPDVRRLGSLDSVNAAAAGLSLGRNMPVGALGFSPAARQEAAPARTRGMNAGIKDPAAVAPSVNPERGPPPDRRRIIDPRGKKEGRTGVRSLDKTKKRLGDARSLQKKGDSAAISGTLDSLFDFSGTRKKSSFGAGAAVASGRAAALPDPKVLGVDKAVSKLAALAAAAGAAEAPFLFQRAVNMARESGKTKKAAAVIRRAAQGAAKGVAAAGNRALAAASQGRTTDALRFTKAVHGWNALLSTPKQSYIANYPEFRDAVKHVLGETLSSAGRKIAAPTVSFTPLAGAERTRLRALVKMPAGIANQVKALPAGFLADLALPELDMPWEEVVPLDMNRRLYQGFGLTPQAGFRGFYRAHRAAGSGIFKSFWLAARRFLGAGLSGFWQRFKALVVSLLRSLGILRGAAAGAAAVDVSQSVLSALRAAPGRRLAVVPPGQGLRVDALGYRRYSTSK